MWLWIFPLSTFNAEAQKLETIVFYFERLCVCVWDNHLKNIELNYILSLKGVIGCKIHFSSCLNINVHVTNKTLNPWMVLDYKNMRKYKMLLSSLYKIAQ